MGVSTGKIESEFHNIDTVVVVNNSDLGAQAMFSRSDGSVVKLNTTKAFQEQSESFGILTDEDDPCPASTIMQQTAMKEAVCQKKFSLLHPFCNLGNFDGAINCSLYCTLIYGTQGFFTSCAGEWNLSIVDRCENEQVKSVTVLEKIWDVELASAGNGMELDSRVRKGVRPAQAIVMCYVDTPSQAKLWQQLIRCFELCHCETKSSLNYRGAAFDEMGLMSHTTLSQVADSLFDDLSTTEIKIAHFQVAICVASHSDSIDVALLGSSEKVFNWTNKRKRATFLSLMDTFLSRLFRMETHETTQTIICRWLICFLLPCDWQKKVPLLTGTLNTWFNANILYLPLENKLVKLSVPLLDELENAVYNHFSSQGVVNLLGVVSVLTKSDPNVILLADLQGIQNAGIFTTLQITFLLCQVTLTCLAFHDGCFVWYAHPVYQRFTDNIGIWKTICELHKSICWDLMAIRNITLKQVGAVTCWQPSMRDCCIDIDQTTAFFQSRCFSIAAVMGFLQTNLSSRYSYGLVFLMVTKASHYLLHLVYLAALLWTLKHKCGINKSISLLQLTTLTLVTQLFLLKHTWDISLAVAIENIESISHCNASLSVILVNYDHKRELLNGICSVVIFLAAHILLVPMQLMEKWILPQVMTIHQFLSKEELVPFGIWVRAAMGGEITTMGWQVPELVIILIQETNCMRIIGWFLSSVMGPFYVRVAWTWAYWRHHLTLPSAQYGFFIVFSSQVYHSILLQELLQLPITCKLLASLGNSSCAAQPNRLWYIQLCKDMARLQTHMMITYTLESGVIYASLNGRIHAILLLQSFSIGALIGRLQINVQFSSLTALLIEGTTHMHSLSVLFFNKLTHLLLIVGSVGLKTYLIAQKVEFALVINTMQPLCGLLKFQSTNATHGQFVMPLVFVETKNGVNDVAKTLVELVKYSKLDVRNWLNIYGLQAFSYLGDQSQRYGSCNFGGYHYHMHEHCFGSACFSFGDSCVGDANAVYTSIELREPKIMYSTFSGLYLLHNDIPASVVCWRYWPLNVVLEWDLLIVDNGTIFSVCTMQCQSTTKQSEIDGSKLVHGISNMQVLGAENVTKHALSILQQEAAQVILFDLYGEEYQMLLTGSPWATPTYKLFTPPTVKEEMVEADVLLIVIQELRNEIRVC